MKKFFIIVISIFFLLGVVGCAQDAESVAQISGDLQPVQTEVSSEEEPEPDTEMHTLPGDAWELSSEMYQMLETEWNNWNAKTQEQKLLSSHIPGHCYIAFNEWAECEEFLGFRLDNPLEDTDWLEKGTYVGMPIGYADASRFYVSFYGDTPEQVRWIWVESGYYLGDFRITVQARIETELQAEQHESIAPRITEDSGERYVATTAELVREAITYNIRVIGEPNQTREVKEMLNKVLVCFGISEQDEALNLKSGTPVSEATSEPIRKSTEKIISKQEEQGVTDGTEVKAESHPSLLDFLEIAGLPVGQTMYVWGGGWNEEDTGAGVEAVSLGVSTAWASFAAEQDASYDYNKTRYQIHDGLDCSGYVGWAVYNVLETENGKDGYVLSSTKMAEEFAHRGLGEYIPAKELSRWQAGDIMSMKGHVWIAVGMCEDGSVLFLHSSPPGVSFCGTKLVDGSKSMAISLAEQVMETYYPEWYQRFPECARPYSYLTEASAMRWSEEVLRDEEGIAGKSAEEVITLLFAGRN